MANLAVWSTVQPPRVSPARAISLQPGSMVRGWLKVLLPLTDLGLWMTWVAAATRLL